MKVWGCTAVRSGFKEDIGAGVPAQLRAGMFGQLLCNHTLVAGGLPWQQGSVLVVGCFGSGQGPQTAVPRQMG